MPDTMDDALTTIREAFRESATSEARARGVKVLEMMLTALRGSDAASAATTTAEPKTPPPDLLDYIIHTLKQQLTDEDRLSVESDQVSFALPFVNL